MKKKKKSEVKLIYHYVKPRSEAEKESQQQDVDAAYDILFEAVLRNENSTKET